MVNKISHECAELIHRFDPYDKTVIRIKPRSKRRRNPSKPQGTKKATTPTDGARRQASGRAHTNPLSVVVGEHFNKVQTVMT